MFWTRHPLASSSTTAPGFEPIPSPPTTPFLLVAILSSACLLLSTGCGDGKGSGNTGSDSGVSPDAGSNPDSGVSPDAGPPPEVPVIGGCQLFPADNFWNTPIDNAPVHPDSDAYIASIGADVPFHPDFGAPWEGAPNGIPFDVVPADQPTVDVTFDYFDESDPGPYPIPPTAQIEGGPSGDGDRHVLLVQESTCILYELYYAYPQGDGSWTAGSGAIWHLDQNEVRPQGWTSADAAGLAILPGLIRYDEVNVDGEINHAIRVTVSAIQRGYILPATHSDGTCGDDPTCPPMGLRLRLKASFDETALPAIDQVILRAMKKYGLVVADTGSDMYLSGVPDDRWDDDALHQLNQVHAGDLEAVYTGEIIPY